MRQASSSIMYLIVLSSVIFTPFISSAISPNAAEQAFQAAEGHWKAKQWEQAVPLYEGLIAEYPNLPEAAKANLRLGEFYEETDLQKAVYNFTRASEVAPGTRTAHAAKIHLARFSYLTGNYAESRRLIRDVLFETRDWDTVKKSTYLLKRVDRIIQHLDEGSELISSCGTEALKEIASLKGLSPERESTLVGENLILTMKELKEKAAHLGLEARGVSLSYDDALGIEGPWIAHFKKNHFVVVTKMNNDRVNIIDSDRRHVQLTATEFQKRWSGNAMIFGEDRQVDDTLLLSDAQMLEVRGGHHLHGDDLGGPCDNPASGYDSGPSSLSGGTLPGMPFLSVNISNFNLLVQDIDISIGSRGPDIYVKRTYNADDSGEGIFGRSWQSNYEAYLVENPGGDVDIKRASGKMDNFAPVGDGTYTPPIRVYDELIKNPDGTFDLTLKGSRLVKHFDTSGRLISIADHNGNSLTLQYSGGQLFTVTDAVGRRLTFSYWPTGKVKEIKGPLQRTAYFYYDGDNNLTQTVDMDGNVVDYTYNEYSYMTSITTPKGTTEITNIYYEDAAYSGYVVSSITDPLGNRKEYWSDKLLVYTRDPNGNTWTYYNKSPYGETTEITDPLGNKTVRGLDSAGNVKSVTDPNGNTISLTYDSRGNVTSVAVPLTNNTTLSYYSGTDLLDLLTDPAGNVYDFNYDGNDNLTQVLDPEGGVTHFSYTQYGEIKTLTDANGKEIAFSYDSEGNLSAVTNPLSSESFTYDDRGRVATYTDAQNRTTTITYDDIDRITNITYDDLTEKTINYDCCSITDITDPSGTLYFTHDDANRLTSFTDIHGKTLDYEYDGSGNLIKLTYPDGKYVLYDYDKANRLISVTDWLGNETSYEYDPGGRLTMTIYPNGITTIYTYDNADRLVSLLSYDVSGQIITSYDYAYDQLHNRTAGSAYQPLQRSPHPATSAYAYDDENRLLSVDDDTYSYNESGELTGRVEQGSSATYTWTITGMLNSVSSGTDTYEYAYDPIRNRVSRTYNGVKTRYVVDPSSVLLAETDGQGNITAYYVYGLGLISKITPQGDEYYYHYNALGSTVAMTDSVGAVVNKYAYGIFGQVIDGEEQVGNPFKYVGAFGVMDEGNGLYYMRARYYDPETGRFISKDPIGLAGGINMYAYAGGNPVNWIDPLGLKRSGKWSGTGWSWGGVFIGGGAFSGIYKVTSWDNPSKSCTILVTCYGAGAGLGGSLSWDSIWISGACSSQDLASHPDNAPSGVVAFGGAGITGVGGSLSSDSGSYGAGVGGGGGFIVGECKTSVLSCN